MFGCAHDTVPEKLEYRAPPEAEVMVRAAAVEGTMGLKAQLEKRLRKVKQTMDVTIRCKVNLLPLRGGSAFPDVCFAEDEKAQALHHHLNNALTGPRFTSAWVDYEKTGAVFPISMRLRTGPQSSADVWLHHGNIAEDGDTTYEAPQLWPTGGIPWQDDGEGCRPFARPNTSALLIDPDGRVISVRSGGNLTAQCMTKLLFWARQMRFFPAVRNGEPVVGVFPLLVNLSKTTRTEPGPESSYNDRRGDRIRQGPSTRGGLSNYRTLIIRPPLPRHSIEDFVAPGND
ncbi:MAG: hypothetical protein AAF610_12665 [Pseudomonadota bacterium]